MPLLVYAYGRQYSLCSVLAVAFDNETHVRGTVLGIRYLDNGLHLSDPTVDFCTSIKKVR